MRFNTDFKSRFRILKGGKISLVVSALLVSASLSTPANALVVDTAVTTTQSANTADGFEDIEVTSDGSVIFTADGTDFAALYGTGGIYTGVSVSNSGTISLTNTDQSSIMRGIFTDGSNEGTISNLSSGTIDIDSTSTANNFGGGTAIQTVGNSGDITLDGGDITVTSVTNARGVFITGNHTGTITNSALLSTTVNTHPASSISNQSIGIDITGTMSSASIVNSGTINSSSDRGVAAGILVAGAVTDSTITNSWNINATGTGSARAYGISLKGGTVGTTTITNDGGTITATNQYSDATGINIIGNSAGTITNSGTIDVTAGSTGKGRGIYIDGDFDGNITNSSSILVDGDTTRLLHGINITGTLTGNVSSTFMEVTSNTTDTVGIEVDTVSAGSTVVNSATLISKSYGDAWAAGIVADDNNGTIETRSLLDTYSKDGNAYGIFLGGANEGTISTYSRVKAESIDGDAYGMWIDENNGDIVVETGSINVKSTNGGWYSSGILVWSGDGSGNIITEADTSITVDIGGTGANAMGILSYDNNITNEGTISSYKDEVLDKSAFSIYSPSTGAHTVTNPGTLNGNLKVENGTLTNSGTIALPHNAYAEDRAWVGDFTNKASGTLTIGLQTDGSTTTHSQLGATTAIFEDGSTINVDVTAVSTNEGNIDGERLDDVVWTNNGLTVNGTLNITDNSTLLNFEIIRDENSILDTSTIDLLAVQAKTVEDSVTLGGGSQSAKNFSKALLTANSQNTPLITHLNTLGTDAQVAKAVSTALPNNQATEDAKIQVLNNLQGIVDMRQRSTFGTNTGGNSGDTLFSDKNAWFKPFGTISEQKDKDGNNGFDVKAYGFGVGVDSEYKDNQRAGLAFFYTNASLDVNNVQKESNMDVYTLLTYGNIPVIDDKTKFLYQLGYSWQKTNNESIFGANEAISKYTATTASLDLKLMRDYQINSNWLVQPIAEITYRNSKSPAYSETFTNISVDKFKTTQLIAGIGAISHYKLDEDSKVLTTLNVGYDLHDKSNSVTASLGGTTFETEGIDNGRTTYKVGVGYERSLDEVSDINIMFEREGQGSSFTSNTISAKYVYKF